MSEDYHTPPPPLPVANGDFYPQYPPPPALYRGGGTTSTYFPPAIYPPHHHHHHHPQHHQYFEHLHHHHQQQQQQHQDDFNNGDLDYHSHHSHHNAYNNHPSSPLPPSPEYFPSRSAAAAAAAAAAQEDSKPPLLPQPSDSPGEVVGVPGVTATPIAVSAASPLHHPMKRSKPSTMGANGVLIPGSNKKERRRTQSINNAFANLRDCIPNVPCDTKLSKIKTLRLATSYIDYLMTLLNSDSPDTFIDGFKADIHKKWNEKSEEQKRRELEAELNNNRDATGAIRVRPGKGGARTGWPQHVWALELKQ